MSDASRHNYDRLERWARDAASQDRGAVILEPKMVLTLTNIARSAEHLVQAHDTDPDGPEFWLAFTELQIILMGTDPIE